MAFLESERVKIRRYMGWPPGATEPSYDALITRIQSIGEGGSMPDSSTEDEARALLADLATVETTLRTYWEQMEGDKVDELRADSARATLMMRSEGRRIVRNLACLLDAKPLTDAFSPSLR